LQARRRWGEAFVGEDGRLVVHDSNIVVQNHSVAPIAPKSCEERE